MNSQIERELEDAFDEAVRKYFIKIAEDYKCLLKKINEREFQLISEKCIVTIMLGIAHIPDIIITLKPNYDNYKRYGKKAYGLGLIVDVFNPRFNLGLGKVKNRKDVLRSLSRQSRAFLKYCIRMLEGDFSDWPRLKKIVTQRLVEDMLKW